MPNAIYKVPAPINEPVKSYGPGTSEREALKKALKDSVAEHREIPMYIGANKVISDNKINISAPHDHKKIIGSYYKSSKEHVSQAVDAALKAKKEWANMPWEHRASIFLKAAELLAGPFRQKMNAATMIGQSKNPYQAEIDAACELIDFFRFNVQYATDIYRQQPESAPGMWNRLEYRPLEGFVFALTPFNFTSIAGNLPAAPALMGNTVVWKPSENQVYSAQVIMELFQAAGLPDGVVNLVYPSGPDAGEVCFSHKEFAGIHFTGSSGVFNTIWKEIGGNVSKYNSYPRIVGETGGKDFIMIHESADVLTCSTAISRGAFEYQGQKCSAPSRVYVPSNLWPEIKDRVVADVESFKMGVVEDFGNFINAVINEKSFDKLAKYIDDAKKSDKAEIIVGGKYDKSEGYFIEPTIIVTTDPHYVTMCEELFGPVLTVYVYDPKDWQKTLELVDKTSPYALTGAIISQDRKAIIEASNALSNAAGNFYINDKPTGAVVGQQPFGGARASGTNDKAGSSLNLLRWVSARTIKETFVAPTDYRYPFLESGR
ncbi:MAG: L-glutamate gamma-semialdehyde dehydrogenase [Bacteroidia bacterium]